MKRKDFYFDLPQELIAQSPSLIRGEDKLMCLSKNTGKVFHYEMKDLPSLIDDNTLLVFNNSKVRKARVFGIKESTARRQEFMFLNKIDEQGTTWNTIAKNAKKQKPGMKYFFPDGSTGIIVDDEKNIGAEFRAIKFDFPLSEDWFEKNGHIPLPPYIKREDNKDDSERYQNVYAKEIGSAACPTAGLHFTEDMIKSLHTKGIESVSITLHVGLGTFLPVREEEIENHKMHKEFYTISEEVAEKINTCRKNGKKILAVGTTSVRTLESSCDESGFVKAGTNSTNIFMYPGFKFKVVDEIFTNFHTPESTLLMLVSAFAGRENILNAYNIAIAKKYKFFSYGDAMIIKDNI